MKKGKLKLDQTAAAKLRLRETATYELWRRGEMVDLLLKEPQRDLYNDFKSSDHISHFFLCSRRFGKCLAKGTKVHTILKGDIPIEELRKGDMVWGYNGNKILEPTNVVAVFDQGEKEVVDLVCDGETLSTCTLDHRWLVWNSKSGITAVKPVKKFDKFDKIVTKDVDFILWDRYTHKNKDKYKSVTVENKRVEQTYDITVNNDSNLYMLANGMITHNTVTLLSIAINECMSTPGTRVLFLSSTTEQVREIIDQASDVVLETCPPDLKPVMKQKENKFIFKNGSEIRIKGLDRVGGSAIRGVGADLVIFDEACFMNDLEYIYKSIVLPMVIATGGRVLFGSTPPMSAGHESVQIIAECEKNDALTKKTIYDMQDILYSKKQIEVFENSAGGKDTTLFRREYLAEIITETELAITPGFRESTMVKEVPFPAFNDNEENGPYWPDCYVAMDLGFRDLTVCLFGYWDYPTATLVVQDELVFSEKTATTKNIAESIKKKEKELWGKNPPKGRWCDNEPRFIEDIKVMHDLRFKRTNKDNKEASVNQLNVLINNENLIVHPRCKTLIQHLKYGLWKPNRLDFQRTKELGHCDAIDALVYMLRNVKRNSDPTNKPFYPEGEYAYHGFNQVESKWGTLKKLFK